MANGELVSHNCDCYQRFLGEPPPRPAHITVPMLMRVGMCDNLCASGVCVCATSVSHGRVSHAGV